VKAGVSIEAGPLKSHSLQEFVTGDTSALPSHSPFTINQTPLILPHRQIASHLALSILAGLLPTVASAQQPTPHTIVLIDPAHGGPDTGAHLPNNVLEKDQTLAFATRLRTLLSTSGFTIISTRDADPTVTFTTDQRAEIANHAHPAACLVLHATDSGNGIHIVTSALVHSGEFEGPHPIVPWNAAQADSVPQSLALANELGLALQRAKLPVILSRASVRPVDNLTCPAVAIEIAPLTPADSDPTPITNVPYQQNIAKAIAAGLASWRAHQIAALGAGK
jgi:N-acetylmuramoyl-L-alanine amidase